MPANSGPILLMHGSLVCADAIGSDLLAMQLILGATNDCRIFAENTTHNQFPFITVQAARDLLNDPRALVIYHHSYYWPLGELLLRNSAAKIVFRYHNITPPIYSLGAVQKACAAALAQTQRFGQDHPTAMWLPASEFSKHDVPHNRTSIIIPPFIDFETLALKTEHSPAKTIIDGETMYCLMVGRVAPHKGHKFALEILRRYRDRLGHALTLRIVGKKVSGCPTYYGELMAIVNRYQLQDRFQYEGVVSREELGCIYKRSDVVLCCSEHEGFAVPVVEAQYMSVPVIVRSRGAMPQTVGRGGLVLGEDPEEYVDCIEKLRSDGPFADSVVKSGAANYDTRFRPFIVKESFLQALDLATRDF